jgi:HlyD family secretion protein
VQLNSETIRLSSGAIRASLRRRKTTMPIKRIVAALLACSGAVLAWHYTRPVAPVFQTAAIERGDIQSIVASSGTVSAVVTVQVGSQVSGIIKALYADFNSTVQKDELVAEIDPEPFIAKLNQAKAALDSAKAAVDAAKAGVEKARADIQSAKLQAANQKSQMQSAESAESFAKLQADRAAESAKAAVGTVSDQAAAQAALEVAADTEAVTAAQADAASVAIEVTQQAYDTAVNQVTTAAAQVAQAQGVVDQAQLDLDHTKILSPTEGVVLSRQVDVGQTVAAGYTTPTLFQIAQDLTQMQVDADIDQSDVSRVTVGEDVSFTVDALPNMTFRTTVAQVRENPVNIQNVITYDVVLKISNPDLLLFPGMTANVRLQTALRPNVLKIPSGALRFLPPGTKREPNVQSIYTLDATGKPVSHQVTTGIGDGRFVEMVSGDLPEGSRVIVSQVRAK